jgi:hypothetical protein
MVLAWKLQQTSFTVSSWPFCRANRTKATCAAAEKAFTIEPKPLVDEKAFTIESSLVSALAIHPAPR